MKRNDKVMLTFNCILTVIFSIPIIGVLVDILRGDFSFEYSKYSLGGSIIGIAFLTVFWGLYLIPICDKDNDNDIE